jgi:endo-1,4-beta-xylanase
MAITRILAGSLLAALAIASPLINERATTTTPTQTNPSTTIVATATGKFGLNDAAKQAGKIWFGTAADIPGDETSDKYYMKEFNNTHDFGEATPANIMKVRKLDAPIYGLED